MQLSGSIHDAESGEPVESALVELVETGQYSMTDGAGYFEFRNVESGIYHIRVSRIGYHTLQVSSILVNKGTGNRLSLRLKPQPLQLTPVVVTRTRPGSGTENLGVGQVLGPGELSRYRNEDFSEVLQKVAGLEVLSSSGKGGPVKVSIHGGSSNQVLVLLDGIRLNNPETGEVDLALVDLKELEKIEIVRQGNAAVFGNQAFDGVIRLYSKNENSTTNLRLNSSVGSFETAEGGIRAGAAWKTLSFKTGYRQNWSRQNYTYNYRDAQIERQNSWYRNATAFGQLGLATDRMQGKLLFHQRRSIRGLPSTPFNEQIPAVPSVPFNPRQEQIQKQLQGYIKFILNKYSLLELRAGLQQLWQNSRYADDGVPRKLRYDTDQLNRQVNGGGELTIFPGNEAEIKIGGEWLWEYLEQRNNLVITAIPAKNNRKSYSFYGTVNFPLLQKYAGIEKLEAVAALRFQKYFSEAGHWYPYAGLALVPSVLPSLRIFGNYAEGVRYPDFNSLFWVGDARAQGNPNLLPEKKKGGYLQIIYQPLRAGLTSIDLSAFSEKVDNLIFWHRRFDGVWEPRNEQRIKKWGWDLRLLQPIVPGKLDLSINYSRLFTRNEKEDPVINGKKLVFAPEHTWHLTLHHHSNNWNLLADFRQVSEKETVISNSEGTQIPAFKVLDFSINRLFHLTEKLEAELGLQIKNLTNEDYQLLLGYPMPGRAFYIHSQINIKP
ncbi:MAG: hypothetical protein Kow0037_03010 [Calditrichia bacterium]